MACNKNHDGIQQIMENLPTDQGGVGRHKCAACAYEAGYKAGYNLDGSLSIDNVLANLDESQARAQRHKSPHAAYALGYYHGVCQRTQDDNN
ncbi:MAG: hypothetical protein LRY59_04935 [Bacteroides graminisolvens]|jgi:hypothetical protein|nr:hypothetical protein [Bacteroides graminisolvens]